MNTLKSRILVIVSEPKKEVVKDKCGVGGRNHSSKKGKKEVLELSCVLFKSLKKKKTDQEFVKETCNQHIYKMQLHGNQIH